MNLDLHGLTKDEVARVEVIMARSDGQLLLKISDDGRGFDEAQVDEAERFGLQGMFERAEMIGAQLSVKSIVGQGTLVQLTMMNDN